MNKNFKIEDISEDEGYLYAVIDNQKINYQLKKIIKKDTIITGDNVIDIYFGTDIPILHMIHRIDNENKEEIEDGLIEVYLVENEELKILDNIIIENSRINKNIKHNLKIGTYTILLKYNENKIDKESYFPIILNINKRNINISFEKENYIGNAGDYIDIDMIAKDNFNIPISNVNFEYYINEKEIKKITTDENGHSKIHLYLPDITDNECENNYIYTLFVNFSHSLYNQITKELQIQLEKKETNINFSTISSYNNMLSITGNIISKYNNTINNVTYGNVDVYILNKYINNIQISKLGEFILQINYNSFLNDLDNNIDESINKSNIEKIETVTNIKVPDEIHKKEEIEIYCEVSSKSSLINKATPIKEGMVKFYLLNNRNEILDTFISETNKDGICYGYFNISDSKEYIFVAEYCGVFEYKNSISNQEKRKVI